VKTTDMTAEGRSLLARLREFAAEIAAAEAEENARIEEQKASYLRQGKGFTDPRTGVTYFPRNRHGEQTGRNGVDLRIFKKRSKRGSQVRAEKEEHQC